MRKCWIVGVAALGLLLGGAGEGLADAPLTLEYVVTDLGGAFQYDFTLRLDNNDGTWRPGQGFGWLVFGDERDDNSFFRHFQVTSGFPVGPWDHQEFTCGFHNGISFGPPTTTWVPSAIGDSLEWSGTVAYFLDQGELLFSSIITSGGAHIIEFEVANNVTP
jgi:hypothetical protein